MPSHLYGGKAVDVDADGFLINPKDWTRELAEAIAEQEGITLTGPHWKVLDFARGDFVAQGQSPGPRRITAATSVSTKELYQLFPKGPGKLVAKIAGVPKPKSCL